MSASVRPDAVMLRIGRRRLRMTRSAMAEALGISERALAYYEAGRAVPKTVMLAAGALFGAGSAEAGMGRERWVNAVDHLLRYGRGEPVAGRLLRERRLQDLADMLHLARHGPDPAMAMTDPARFAALRSAATKAYLSGLMMFGVPSDASRSAADRDEPAPINPETPP